MKLKIKKLYSDAIIPQAQRLGDAGLDIYSFEDYELQPGERHAFKTGIASEFSPEYVVLVWDRGGLAVKHGITCLAGVIDSNYRGEWMICLLNTSDKKYKISKGNRIAQAIIQRVELLEIEEAEELSNSERGENWKGSSGK